MRLATAASAVTTTDAADDEDDDAMDDDADDDEATRERRDEHAQRAQDHQLIQVLNTLLKIFDAFPAVLERDYHQYVDELAYESQKLLAYEHVWVRQSAARALDNILARLDVDRVRDILCNGRPAQNDEAAEMEEDAEDGVAAANNGGMDFIYSNPRQQLKSLALDLCAQLLPEVTDEEMAAQVTKNLLYVANLIRDVTLEKQTSATAAGDDDDADGHEPHADDEPKAINMVWLIRRMRYVVHAEVAKAPHSIVLVSV